jgi:hypothetical protein
MNIMDQVQHYIEMEPKSKITKIGSSEVLMRKVGPLQKRFIATFAINRIGDLLHTHIFSIVEGSSQLLPMECLSM